MSKVSVKSTSQQGYACVVNTIIDGTRRRKFFKTKKAAKAYAEAEETRLANQGTREASRLTEAVLKDAAWGAKQLESKGKSLRDAVTFYLAHLDANERSCTITELASQIHLSKQREGKSARYLRDMEGRYKRFEQTFGKRLVSEIATEEISQWLTDLNLSPVSRANYRRLLVLLFNEGMKRKVCTENPAKDSEKPKQIEGEVSILTVKEAGKLLENSSDEILPTIAIGLFAGLRTSELQRLEWDEIDFEAGHILVKAEKAKSARKRYVKISENLQAWIEPFAKRNGHVAPQGREYWTKFQEARKSAGLLADWEGNEMRHSFASYHLAMHNDPGLTTTQLGHTSPHLVYQHYRNLVKPAEATEYWNIKPTKEEAAKNGFGLVRNS